MNIAEIIFKRLKITSDCKINYVNKNCVYVKLINGEATVSNYTKSYLTRGLTLLAKEMGTGKTEFEIIQKPCFENRGIQLELSRNGVMRVSSIKKIIEYMACEGLNSLVLYLEDVYKLKDYPYFGYMRGSYSEKELCEIDDYAHELGIEVIPAIQVLGHMEQYLRWPEASPVKCNSNILLCGEERTYNLIETMIATMRRSFRTHKIHIGCDEANEVALGEYIKRNGYRNGVDVINEHVARVLEICKKYDFKAMMYSDMYFKLYSKEHRQFDENVEFPEDIANRIPDVDLVYWDYGHITVEEYDALLKKQGELGKKTIFYGGLWSWGDLLPRYEYTFSGLIPGVKACIKNNISDVYATTWGDDGNECSRMYDLFATTILSEICFKGEDCSIEEIYDMSKFLFGIEPEFYKSVSEIGMPSLPYGQDECGLSDTWRGKGLFYTDILYNLTGTSVFYEEAKGRYHNSAKTIQGTFAKDEWKPFEEHAVRIYNILELKAEIITNIRRAYHNKDREYLEKLTNSLLPELIQMYQELLPEWQNLWLADYKPFGWEVINGRLGFVIARLQYAKGCIEEYLSGKIERIEEFEDVFLENADMALCPNFKNMVSTGYVL